MDNLTDYLISAIVILIVYIFWIHRKFNSIGQKIQSYQEEIKKFRNETNSIKGRLMHAETIDLDLSVIENQVEENSQQLFSAFREKIYEISSRIKELEVWVETADEEGVGPAQRISELESRIEELEEEMERRLAEIEAGMGKK